MPASSSSESKPSEAVFDDRPSSPLEVHRFHCLRSLFLMGYVVVLLVLLGSLRFFPPVTDWGKLVYVYGLLIGPAALFLLLLHLYEFRGLVRSGTHALPLTIDLTFFSFLVSSAVTFGVFWRLFQVYEVSARAFTLTWWGFVALLAGELLGCMLAARIMVRRWVCPRLPSFFESSDHHHFRRPRDRPRPFLHRNIPNWTIWEQDDCFMRIKRV